MSMLRWIYYRPQRSCGQGYVFTRVCDSVHRGGGSPGRENPRRLGDHHPPPAGRPPPPGPGRPPRLGDHHPPPGPGGPPRLGDHHPPPRKQTSEYGLRAAGTHPTGMHSCYIYYSASPWEPASPSHWSPENKIKQECIPVGCVPPACQGGCLSARGCLPATPPWTEWQTHVKTLPCRNYVADSNKFITEQECIPVGWLLPTLYHAGRSLYCPLFTIWGGSLSGGVSVQGESLC